MEDRIPCFKDFVKRNPDTLLLLKVRWEDLKCAFSDDGRTANVDVPYRLACEWERLQCGDGLDEPGIVHHFDMIPLKPADL